MRIALKACGYPKWAFNKAMSQSNRITEQSETQQSQLKNLVIPYMAGVSEKLRGTFGKHHILMHFKPTNTLMQRLFHPKDWTPKHNRSNIVYVAQCQEECSELYIGDTK